MNKTELVAAVAAKAELSKKDAEAAVSAVLDSVKDALADGDKVSIVGFGTFAVKTRAAREGINPLTKAPMSIPETKVPTFKAGSALKDAVK
ncbi:MAG TPA: integration host factor subunit alpha [Ruminococcaceae bacterium]|nr:HU family DNA-binding protein [Eubacterium sp.]MDE6470409.1 HU family DNA-binding protein [Eubacterium sp.]HBN39120.1 integration host factor subunit alpha [Oscillospiraceae bacterium]